MRWLVLVFGLAALAVASPAEATRLTAVEVRARRGETVVRLRVDDGGVRPGVHMLSDHRLIVDLPDVEPVLSSHRIPGGTPILERVRIGLHNDPAPRTRVVFDLAGPAAYSVEFVETGLDVVLRGPDSRATDDSPAASRPTATPGAPTATAEPITVTTPAPTAPPSPRPAASPTAPEPSPRPSASPSPEPTVRPSPSPSPEPTARPSPSPSPEPTARPSPAPQPTRRPAPTASPAPSPTAETTTAPSRATASRGDGDGDRTDREAPDAEAIPSGTVTLDFTSADVRSVIDLVANVGGYDVIFTPEVRGKVTIRVIDAPWEEALDAILEKKRLRATRHADLILVSPDDTR